MTIDQIEFLKNILLKLKKNIEEELFVEYNFESNDEKFKDDENNLTEEGEITAYANIVNFQTKKEEYFQKYLNQINYALEKIDNNIYGICEESGENICFERLKANPIAKYCVEIQNMYENNH